MVSRYLTFRFLGEVGITFILGLIISLMVVPLWWKFRIRKIKRNIPPEMEYKIKLERIRNRFINNEREKRY